MSGRGPKRALWVTEIYRDILHEFERQRAAAVRFSTSLLLQEARSIVERAPEDTAYHPSDCINGIQILDKITTI